MSERLQLWWAWIFTIAVAVFIVSGSTAFVLYLINKRRKDNNES